MCLDNLASSCGGVLIIMLVGVTSPMPQHLYISVRNVSLLSWGGCYNTEAMGVVLPFAILSADSRLSNATLKSCQVRPLPSESINRGPERLPLNAKYGRMPLMWSTKVSLSRTQLDVDSLAKGSVFDCFIYTCSIFGLSRLTIAMSLRQRWHPWSNRTLDGMVNLLTHKNPKNARQCAAHVITFV